MFGDGADSYDVMIRAEPNVQLVTDLELFRAFGAVPVHLDLPRFDGGYRERPRFEKPRGPKPFVEPDPCNLV